MNNCVSSNIIAAQGVGTLDGDCKLEAQFQECTWLLHHLLCPAHILDFDWWYVSVFQLPA